MPDREACATELSAAMPKAAVATQASILETLGAMGGAKALETIGAAVKGNNRPVAGRRQPRARRMDDR